MPEGESKVGKGGIHPATEEWEEGKLQPMKTAPKALAATTLDWEQEQLRPRETAPREQATTTQSSMKSEEQRLRGAVNPSLPMLNTMAGAGEKGKSSKQKRS